MQTCCRSAVCCLFAGSFTAGAALHLSAVGIESQRDESKRIRNIFQKRLTDLLRGLVEAEHLATGRGVDPRLPLRVRQRAEQRMVQLDLRHVLEADGRDGDPLGVVLADALARDGPQPQLLRRQQCHFLNILFFILSAQVSLQFCMKVTAASHQRHQQHLSHDEASATAAVPQPGRRR